MKNLALLAFVMVATLYSCKKEEPKKPLPVITLQYPLIYKVEGNLYTREWEYTPWDVYWYDAYPNATGTLTYFSSDSIQILIQHSDTDMQMGYEWHGKIDNSGLSTSGGPTNYHKDETSSVKLPAGTDSLYCRSYWQEQVDDNPYEGALYSGEKKEFTGTIRPFKLQ